MPLKHADVWRAIDRLAEINGLSASGLARKSGLSPTVFNPSKRVFKKRKRWPTTESISQILHATNTELNDFVALATPSGMPTRTTLPLLGYAQAGRDGYFDEAGYPAGRGWDEVTFTGLTDSHAFVLEISGKSMEPMFREGDRIVVSPAERPRRNDRVVLRTKKGEVMVKQLGRDNASKIELHSLNPEFPDMSLSPRDIDWLYRILWVSQ
jgi:phage repressor protein C with HTH and peptisase S24 domain